MSVLGTSVDIKLHIEIGGRHIYIESFNWFRKLLITAVPNYLRSQTPYPTKANL